MLFHWWEFREVTKEGDTELMVQIASLAMTGWQVFSTPAKFEI